LRGTLQCAREKVRFFVACSQIHSCIRSSTQPWLHNSLRMQSLSPAHVARQNNGCRRARTRTRSAAQSSECLPIAPLDQRARACCCPLQRTLRNPSKSDRCKAAGASALSRRYEVGDGMSGARVAVAYEHTPAHRNPLILFFSSHNVGISLHQLMVPAQQHNSMNACPRQTRPCHDLRHHVEISVHFWLSFFVASCTQGC
jgi:hypothetical protein